jgi:3-oxoacyl-[acyl-carrier protein] reductase
MDKAARRNRPILVTGASKGIGRAIALRLGAEGYPITAHYGGDHAGAEDLAEAIRAGGGRADTISFDVRDRAATAAALEARLAAAPAYWGVVLSAGVTRDNAFPAITGEDWDVVLRTNLDGFYNVVQPLTMPMVRRKDGGRIMALSSVSGMIGNRGQVNYSASKAGLIGAVKALAVELAKRNITVNCIAPGLVASAMTEDLPPEALEVVPMRRMGTVEEVAAVAAFLVSEEAGYITRQVIAVNGGMI